MHVSELPVLDSSGRDGKHAGRAEMMAQSESHESDHL
jgi:hypothetical protein